MLNEIQITQLMTALDERDRLLRSHVRNAINEKHGRDLPELESTGDESARSIADLLDDIDTGMMIRDVDELMAIESARAAIRKGSYGTCVGYPCWLPGAVPVNPPGRWPMRYRS